MAKDAPTNAFHRKRVSGIEIIVEIATCSPNQVLHLTLSLSVISVGLMLRLKFEIRMSRAEEHFTTFTLVANITTKSLDQITYLILIQSL